MARQRGSNAKAMPAGQIAHANKIQPRMGNTTEAAQTVSVIAARRASKAPGTEVA
jgi:hypothetical protein